MVMNWLWEGEAGVMDAKIFMIKIMVWVKLFGYLMIVAILSAPLANADIGDRLEVSKRQAILYAGPSATATKLVTLSANVQMIEMERQGSWVFVSLKDSGAQQGWVRGEAVRKALRKVVKKKIRSISKKADPMAGRTLKAVSNASLNSSPDELADMTGWVSSGDMLKLLRRQSKRWPGQDDWLYVSTSSGHQGWVQSRYIRATRKIKDAQTRMTPQARVAEAEKDIEKQQRHRGDKGVIKSIKDLKQKLAAVQGKENAYLDGFIINGDYIIQLIRKTDLEIKIKNAVILNKLNFLSQGYADLSYNKMEQFLPGEANDKKRNRWITNVRNRGIHGVYFVGNRIDIRNSEIPELNAWGTFFARTVNFSESNFRGSANFDSAGFADKVSFHASDFNLWANFISARFGGSADFSNVYFDSDAIFLAVRFDQRAVFSHAQFYGNADLRASFGAANDFTGVKGNLKKSEEIKTVEELQNRLREVEEENKIRAYPQDDNLNFLEHVVINGRHIIELLKKTDIEIRIKHAVIVNGLDFSDIASVDIDNEAELSQLFPNQKNHRGFSKWLTRIRHSRDITKYSSYNATTVQNVKHVKNILDIRYSAITFVLARGVWFDKGVTFSNATLLGNADFNSDGFNDRSDFSKTRFNRSAIFNTVHFNGDASFDSAMFAGYSSFKSAYFAADAQFNDAHFNAENNHDYTDFTDAVFTGDAYFKSVDFTSQTDFSRSLFSGKADFYRVSFGREATFDTARFSREADFNAARFSSTTSFKAASFAGESSFSNARIGGAADFSFSNFNHTADFSLVTFAADARFDSASFKRLAYFKSAAFQGTLNLSGFINSQYADFRDSNIKQFNFDSSKAPTVVQGWVDFRGSSIASAHIQDVIFKQEANFSDVHFGAISPRLTLSDVLEWKGFLARLDFQPADGTNQETTKKLLKLAYNFLKNTDYLSRGEFIERLHSNKAASDSLLKESILTGLNDLLKSPDLFQITPFEKVRMSAVVAQLLGDDLTRISEDEVETRIRVLSSSNLALLNRLLLQAEYPDVIRDIDDELATESRASVFRFVTFEHGASFIRTDFSGDTAFENVAFSLGANFSEVRFAKDESEAKFSLSHLTFDKLILDWNNLPKIERWVSESNNRVTSFADKLDIARKQVDLEPLSNVLGSLETAFGVMDQMEDANQASFYKNLAALQEQREAYPVASWENVPERLPYELSWLTWGITTGYGTSIWRTLLWTLAGIIIFALLYLRGIIQQRVEGDPDARVFQLLEPYRHYLRTGSEYKPVDKKRLFHALKLSFVIMTKFGRRDTTISGEIFGIDFKYIVLFQWVMGYCFIIVALYILSKKWPILHMLVSGVL